MSTRPDECGYCNMDHSSNQPCPELDGRKRGEAKKRYHVLVEMEAYGEDGTPIIDGDLWAEVEVEARNEDEASDIAYEMDYGNRIPSSCSQIREIVNKR